MVPAPCSVSVDCAAEPQPTWTNMDRKRFVLRRSAHIWSDMWSFIRVQTLKLGQQLALQSFSHSCLNLETSLPSSIYEDEAEN